MLDSELHKSIRSQSAMEYLMTYGWSILIITVILGALYSVGAFGSSPMKARVCRLKVCTPALMPTATSPTAMPAATEIRFSEDSA